MRRRLRRRPQKAIWRRELGRSGMWRRRASLHDAGAVSFKTSTKAKKSINATLEVRLTMVREIRATRKIPAQVGFKPPRHPQRQRPLNWLILMKEKI